jgi:hypothetical protein
VSAARTRPVSVSQITATSLRRHSVFGFLNMRSRPEVRWPKRQQARARRPVRPSSRVSAGLWGRRLLLLFVVGDILGTGIYALTGQVAARVGGAVWMPFVVAFLVAIITAFSYLELVTKYPRAAGAALYTHKAFGVHFLTFIVAFTVMCSGITSASTASRVFASNLGESLDLDLGDGIKITLVALAFITLVAIVNFRGVGESVKANVVLTCVELSGPHIDHLYWFVGARWRRRHLLTSDPLRGTPGPGLIRCGHRGNGTCLLRHGRLRGLGEHGRGVSWSRSRRSHWCRWTVCSTA